MKNEMIHIRRWAATVVILAALVGGGLLASSLKNWTGRTIVGAAPISVPMAKDALPISLGTFTNGFSSVLKPALPAVVNIHTSKIVKQRQGMNPFGNDPMFRQFFGDQVPQGKAQPEREQSLGSGVILTPDGTIVTNNHVIDGASDIKVQLSDKREFQAKLIGTDPKTDVAVLKIDASGLPTLPLGDSSALHVGDLVFAIGDPFGIGETATMGIVSATGRGGLQIEQYEDFIQTDASINPGNSGGAMIDLHGNLVGINTAILTGGGGGNQGVGFAIPISLAKNVMDQILTHGKVVRGYLGVYIQDVDPKIAKAFGLEQAGGALVGDVSPDTPAARAGLKKGDVILKLNGEPVDSRNQLTLRVSQTPPGTSVKLGVWHDGKLEDVKVTLGELPEKSAKLEGEETTGNSALEGVDVDEITPDIAQDLKLPSGTHGVVVTSVDPASPAATTGLSRGDVIQEVNHKPVHSVAEYNQAITSSGKKPVLLLVNHGGRTTFIVVEPTQ
jgi:serine protease Do